MKDIHEIQYNIAEWEERKDRILGWIEEAGTDEEVDGLNTIQQHLIDEVQDAYNEANEAYYAYKDLMDELGGILDELGAN